MRKETEKKEICTHTHTHLQFQRVALKFKNPHRRGRGREGVRKRHNNIDKKRRSWMSDTSHFSKQQRRYSLCVYIYLFLFFQESSNVSYLKCLKKKSNERDVAKQNKNYFSVRTVSQPARHTHTPPLAYSISIQLEFGFMAVVSQHFHWSHMHTWHYIRQINRVCRHFRIVRATSIT